MASGYPSLLQRGGGGGGGVCLCYACSIVFHLYTRTDWASEEPFIHFSSRALIGLSCGILVIRCVLLSSLHASHLDNGNKIESAAPSAPAQFDNLMMKGNEVFKFAVRTVPQVCHTCSLMLITVLL